MVGDVRPIWFRNPLNKHSLRLTHIGFKWAVSRSKFVPHKITLETVINGKQMLQLERLFSEPYYFNEKSIMVFSETDAVMLQLHAGNLTQYLDNLDQ